MPLSPVQAPREAFPAEEGESLGWEPRNARVSL